METTSEKMKIQCSEMSYRLLRDAPNYEFNLIDRGGIEIKGKGRMNTWFVESGTKRVIDTSVKNGETYAATSGDNVDTLDDGAADFESPQDALQ
jgi:hypothetical protein